MLRDFSLPTYREIPAVGLYLDQTSKYINEVLQELPDCNITNSMISNYVKHHLITNPVKKQYSRDQIACLIFIAVTKNTLSLDEVAAVFEMQKGVCEIQDAYVRFSEIFESYLPDDEITSLSDAIDEVTKDKETNQIYEVQEGDVLGSIA